MASHHRFLGQLAKKYVWWLTPREALRRPQLILCQLMQLGTWDDVVRARELLGDRRLRAALRKAPPGVLDAMSWSYWNRFYFRSAPVPPMPKRPLP